MRKGDNEHELWMQLHKSDPGLLFSVLSQCILQTQSNHKSKPKVERRYVAQLIYTVSCQNTGTSTDWSIYDVQQCDTKVVQA